MTTTAGSSPVAREGVDPAIDPAIDPGVGPGAEGDQQDEEAQRVFSLAILVSAVRCTLTYVIFPFVLPFAGLADFGSVIGVIVSVVAVVANVVSIRRMHRAQHKWRVPVTVINIAMIGLVVALLVIDLFDLFG